MIAVSDFPHLHNSPTSELAAWVQSARTRTLQLITDLSDEQLLGPHLATVNPLLWEIGHLAWFQEKWVLRDGGRQDSVRADADALYDSTAIPHDTRWDLRLPSRAKTLDYMQRVQDLVLNRIDHGLDAQRAYFIRLAVFHEDMHDEAFTITRQTLGYSAPVVADCGVAGEAGPLPGDVRIEGGTFQLGATPAEPFVFDNEKWAHPVEIRPFAIARAPVTQAEFAAFVDDNGYNREELWSDAGWAWRQSRQATRPVYWQRTPDGWQRRAFDHWLSIEPHWPMLHVNWHEADAWCRWAGRRLPTEAEWELAAASMHKRRFPWGDGPPEASQANLDARRLECLDVAALPEGDSWCGCRQMIGNVWEWTADDFQPYPGFVPDPYKEYSQPWFGDHKVLRGGSWATPGRLLRNTWRNFYQPHRADMWAGFRTCAPEAT
jgi:iron(II)-dependent oxidoreductase